LFRLRREYPLSNSLLFDSVASDYHAPFKAERTGNGRAYGVF